MSRFQTSTSSNDLLSATNGAVRSHFSPPRQDSQAGGMPRPSVTPAAPIQTNGFSSNGTAPNGMGASPSSPNGVTNGYSIGQNGHSINGDNNMSALKPVWDREKRELRLDGKVIKRFKWPAGNQERVLNAFEDQGWPMFISDPLDIDPKICPKRRLHDTLKCLNRKQLSKSVKFRGDGTGKGVKLDIKPDADNETNTDK